jgi:hypothetical protein
MLLSICFNVFKIIMFHIWSSQWQFFPNPYYTKNNNKTSKIISRKVCEIESEACQKVSPNKFEKFK